MKTSLKNLRKLIREAIHQVLAEAKCPHCGDPNAYHGLMSVECPNKNCRAYSEKQAQEISKNTKPVAKSSKKENFEIYSIENSVNGIQALIGEEIITVGKDGDKEDRIRMHTLKFNKNGWKWVKCDEDLEDSDPKYAVVDFADNSHVIAQGLKEINNGADLVEPHTGNQKISVWKNGKQTVVNI